MARLRLTKTTVTLKYKKRVNSANNLIQISCFIFFVKLWYHLSFDESAEQTNQVQLKKQIVDKRLRDDRENEELLGRVKLAQNYPNLEWENFVI